MTDLAPPRPEPKRDRWGRYVIPDPETGKEKSWTRATTWAKTLADQYALGKWHERNVAKGISLRADLYALAASTSLEDKAKFEKICEDAKEAAKGSEGRNLGSALHGFTDYVDSGRDVPIPAPWDKDIAAYRAELDRWNIRVPRDWIEQIVLVPQYGVAGTMDRLLEMSDGRRVVGDLKTGGFMAWDQWAIQLALYANATHTYDLATGDVDPIPFDIDQDQAIVVHLPVGQARCELYDVDIAAGWEKAYIAQIVRDWRTDKTIAKPLVSVELEPAGEPIVMTPQDELAFAITRADDQNELSQLWRNNRGLWTADLTAAVKARLEALQTSA